MTKKLTDDEFITLFKRLGSPSKVAKAAGTSVRNVYSRRNSIEQRHGIILSSFAKDTTSRSKITLDSIGSRRLIDVTGMVIIFSDAHFWPNERSKAFDALISMIKTYRDEISLVICNGDAFDGARISRHPPIGHATTPEVSDELAVCQERLAEIETLVKPNVPLVWTLGNHDIRFSSRLAQNASEFVGVHGFDFKDHFPAWDHCWSVEINKSVTVKHRYNNGVHATWNNALRGGRTIVTGHLHALKITPVSDYNGRRYGVDCGTISDFGPNTAKFDYAEDNPLNWASGFAVLTFDKSGELLPPELVEVLRGNAYFRGKIVS